MGQEEITGEGLRVGGRGIEERNQRRLSAYEAEIVGRRCGSLRITLPCP